MCAGTPEIDALVEYVKYLSLRGQVELALIAQIRDLSVGDKLPLDRATLVDTVLLPEVEKWKTAGQKIIQAPPPPENFGSAESIDKGREMFFSQQKANCVKCHGTTALGDGTRDDFDDWTKQVVQLKTATENSLEKLPQNRETAEESYQADVTKIKQDESLSAKSAKNSLTNSPNSMRPSLNRSTSGKSLIDGNSP